MEGILMNVTHNSYGKASVGLLKIIRDGETHHVHEIEVSVRVEGAVEDNYTRGDNRSCVPTDTIKNTVYALAQEGFTGELEPFAACLAEHFPKTYPHLNRATVEIVQHAWQRMTINGQPHPHSFTAQPNGTPFARADFNAGHLALKGGVRHLSVLKSTGSGFEDYHTCPMTTLPPARDRILATRISASWTWTTRPAAPSTERQQVLDAMLSSFSREYSPSVQRTMFLMAKAAFEISPHIDHLTLHLPNEHYFGFDVAKLGLPNDQTIFYPAKKPFGDIEATFSRT